MRIHENDVRSAVETVWTSMLGLALEPDEEGCRPDGDLIAGAVRISGAWNGTVLLECPIALAGLAAARMFGLDDREASPEQICDTLGELANIVGGSVKTLLTEPCSLSIPTVMVGRDHSPDVMPTHEVSRLGFSTEGLPFSVIISEVGDGLNSPTGLRLVSHAD